MLKRERHKIYREETKNYIASLKFLDKISNISSNVITGLLKVQNLSDRKSLTLNLQNQTKLIENI